MYLPPKMTEILHEDRLKTLRQINARRRFTIQRPPLYLRVWAMLRQYLRNGIRRDDQWVSLPLQGESHEVAEALLHTQTDPCAPQNVPVSKPRYQRSDLA